MQRKRVPFRVLRAAWLEYEHDRARYLAVAMVYYLLVSLVPLLLLLLSVLGLLLRFSTSAAEAERQVLLYVATTFGEEARATIEDLLSALQQESVAATVIGVAVLLLAASALFRHLRMSFRAIWKRDPPLVTGRVRAMLWVTLLERVFSFLMVLAGGALLVAALALMAAAQWIYRSLGCLPLLGTTAEWVLPILTSLAIAAITFAVLLKLLPPVRLRWRDVWLAALLCALAWTLGAEALALYGARLGVSPSAAGAFGGVLAFMLWMNFASQALFFAAEVCKVVASRRGVGAPMRPMDDGRRAAE